jgi:hypothetical protein
MDRNRTIDRKALRRIVALLLALADLAERASGRSLAVRRLVLWLLRSGEVLAENYLAKLALHTGPCEPSPLPFTHDSATEAIRLATRFRQLAAALATLAAGCLASSQQAIAAQCSYLVATDPFIALRCPTPAAERRDSS